jgi:hypothetical protein
MRAVRNEIGSKEPKRPASTSDHRFGPDSRNPRLTALVVGDPLPARTCAVFAVVRTAR